MHESSSRQNTERGLSGRLPFCEDGPLSKDQAALAGQLHEFAVPFAERAGFAGTDERGRLIGPWNVLVARPKPAVGFNGWVQAEQEGSILGPRVREVTMLTVAVARGADYAVYSHVAAGLTAGLSQDVIHQLLECPPRTEGLTEAEDAAHRFADQLARGSSVSDDVYDHALTIFGQAGVLDLVHLIAIYLGTCALLGAFAIPSPSD